MALCLQGGVAQAVLSGALGFIAAEAATMWGGAFLWTRTESWRPKIAQVDDQDVDFAWLEGEGNIAFENLQENIQQIKAEQRAEANKSTPESNPE